MNVSKMQEHIAKIKEFISRYQDYDRESRLAKKKLDKTRAESSKSTIVTIATQYLKDNVVLFTAYKTDDGFAIRTIMDEFHNAFVWDMEEIIKLLEERIAEATE